METKATSHKKIMNYRHFHTIVFRILLVLHHFSTYAFVLPTPSRTNILLNDGKHAVQPLLFSGKSSSSCFNDDLSIDTEPFNNFFNPIDDSRRGILHKSLSCILLSQSSMLFNPSDANAATDISIIDKQAKKFKRVPLFAIVSEKTGTPFMILDGSAIAQSYFFTSYDGAKVVLDDAVRDATERGGGTKQMWNDARISAVNMEFALKLAKGKVKATAQNDVKYDTVYDIIPTNKALKDANELDNSGFYNDRGRVPLFYCNEFEIAPEVEGGENRLPVFLETSDLFREFKKKYPEKLNVTITVIDLTELFSSMVGSSNLRGFDQRLIKGNLYVVPSIESRKKAVDLEKERGGSAPAFKVGEMLAVGGGKV